MFCSYPLNVNIEQPKKEELINVSDFLFVEYTLDLTPDIQAVQVEGNEAALFT